MTVHTLKSEELHKEALSSQKPWRTFESLSGLQADDAAVVQLAEICLDSINSQDLKAHKGLTKKQVRKARECFCCSVSVTQLKFLAEYLNSEQEKKKWKCDSVECNSEFLPPEHQIQERIVSPLRPLHPFRPLLPQKGINYIYLIPVLALFLKCT